MPKPTNLPAPQETPAPRHACPFAWSGHCAIGEAIAPGDEPTADMRYIQVRRQGIYLAACIVDDVAALGIRNPQAVVGEIRRRLCELVRFEMQESSRK
jgi:hypothetical protein